MKILLLGKNGMLGSQFESQFSDLSAGAGFVELFAFDHSELDIKSSWKMKKMFNSVLPDIVINCAGYTDVDGAESEQRKAFALNADAVASIAKLCNKYGAILIHFSTDYVFDGRLAPPNGYKEDHMPNPLNVYGESKFKGEDFARKEMARWYVIRTSWLYGPRLGSGGGNFVDTMLRLGKEVLAGKREGIRVVGDQFGSPTYTFDLVRAVIENFVMKFPGDLPEFGLYHLTGNEFCSWHEFALRIFELAEMKVKVDKITSTEYVTDAQRPKNSILINTKLPKMRNWSESLRDYLYKL